MRIAVIRNDLGGPVFLADLEPTSQGSPSMDHGQTRYISRPSTAALGLYLVGQGLTVVATDLIAATVPAGGPVDVSSATIKGVSGLSGASAAQVTAIQDLLAPHLVETVVAKASFTAGNIHKLAAATYNPDPNRYSASAAVVVVEDDGVTPFTV